VLAIADTDQDVTPAETTAPESSTEEQTTAADAAPVETQDTAPAEDVSATDEVPELNRAMERARKAEKELAALRAQAAQAPVDPNKEAIKEQLKQLGFVTREEQEAELRRREEDARVDRELSQLESKYNGSDGRPKFDRSKILDYAIKNGIGNAEIAYKAMHESALTDWAVKHAMEKTRGVSSEGSDGSGSQEVGTTTEDLKAGIRQGDRSALRSFIRRVTSAG
jgi:hypothetical protein